MTSWGHWTNKLERATRGVKVDGTTSRIVEEAFKRICAEEPLNGITRADIQKWVDLLLPLLSERIVVASADGARRTLIGGDTVADLLNTINGYLADGYEPEELIIEGVTR